MLPSLQLLEKVSGKIMSVPNRQKESKRGVHYGLFLLGSKAGLRVNEAVKFDLGSKNKRGLYRIEKPKGKKERFVYIPKKVVRELRKSNWQPNQTNRWNFYHFLRKIKRELGISQSVELTPHTLRRSFTTYHAENGLPLPLLQKLLGHSSIRTTALYWRNVNRDCDDDNDIGGILAGKKWLENKKPPASPIAENLSNQLPKNTEPPILPNLKSPIKPNSPPLIIEPKSIITDYQPKSVISEIPSKAKEKFITETKSPVKSSEPLSIITNQKEQATAKEEILLKKIRNLEEELKQTKTKNSNLKILVQSGKQNNQSLKETNTNLTHKIQVGEQNHTNLINAYQKDLNGKSRAEKQVNYYQDQLKTIAKSLYQWQKINYYQQLKREIYSAEQETKTEAKIIQSPPTKLKN